MRTNTKITVRDTDGNDISGYDPISSGFKYIQTCVQTLFDVAHPLPELNAGNRYTVLIEVEVTPDAGTDSPREVHKEPR